MTLTLSSKFRCSPEFIESVKINSCQVKDFNHFVDRNEANFGKSFDKGAKLDKVIRFIS